MEALFLTDRGYVDERYHEIEGEKRPRNGRSVFPAARANESHEERHKNEIDRLTQEALTLDASWPKDDVEKRVVVMQELLRDLAEQNNAALLRKTDGLTESDEERDRPKVTANSSLTPLALGELPAVTQFGLKLFFRMCQSLRDRSRLQHNARLLVVVAGKLPSVLTALPPFPLSPGVVDLPEGASTDELSSSSVLSVCQELISVFASLLESTASSPGESVESQVDPLSLSSSDKRTVLTALIALSIKWGRLRDLLHAINLLIQHQSLLSCEDIELLHPALRELANAKTDLTPLPLPEEEAASGFLMTFGKGDHGKLGHGQCAHPSCPEGNCTENKSIPTAVDSTQDVRFLKIDSLSTHSIAITAKGELMTWGNGDKYRLGHGSDSHRGSHIELVPYCVDTSKEMLHEVLNLLPKEQLDAWVSQNEKGIKPWNSKLHLEVVLYSLRILGCNFQYWPSGRNYAPSTPKSHDFDTNGGAQDTDATFHRVHEAISTLAKSSDFSGKSIDDESNNLIKAIEVDAAQVIRTGFRYFYPSRADTLSLLWELSVLKHSSAYNDYAGILVEKMCADGAMVEVIQHFFARTPKHTWLAEALWDVYEARRTLKARQHPWWQSPPSLCPSFLEVLGGDVEIQALTIRALQHFPSVRLGKVSITANSGLWYYEVAILSEGLMQIGYVDGDFVSDPLQGQGVGDHVNSWAFDGFRRKKWNVSSYDYGEAWRSGDIVGVLLDSDRMELSYFLNGKFLGVAFSGLPMTPTSLMYPAASLNAEQAIQFNFGARVGVTAREDMPKASVFVHLPQLDAVQDQDRLQSVMMAVDNLSVLEEADEEDGNESDSELSEYEFGIEKSDSEASGCFNEEVVTGRVNQLPGSLGDVTDEEVPTGDVDKYPVDETDDDDAESTRRLDLTTSLVALGFPREWALRCAAETQFIAGDSAAVDWILEQMEQEAMSSVSMTLAGRTGVESSGHVEDITGPSVRSCPTPKELDDLSILSSNTSFGDQFSTLWGVHRVTRPSTEQYIRARGLEELLTNSRSSDGRRHPEATDTDVLCSGNDDNDIVSSLEELAVSSVSTQNAYTLPVTRDLNARLLGQLTGKEPAKDNAEPLGIDWAAEEEDLLPAWIVGGTSLSAAYARTILFETLFAVGDEENVKPIYRLVIGWINRDNRGFFDYLRRQMGLDVRDVRLSTATASARDSCEPKLKIALCRFLEHERSLTEEPVSSLSTAMFNELHSQVKRSLPVVTATWPRLKSSSFLVTQASNAHWSVWLSRVLADVPTERSGQHVLLSGVFLNNVLQVASRTAKCFVPWKVAAFSLLRDALRVSTCLDSDVSSEIQHFFHPDAVLKLFAARWKKEQTSRVAPSILTSILWDILLCRQQLPQSAIFGNLEVSNPSFLQFHIENLSPTHVSVSWDQSKPTSDEYEADLDTSGTAESEASSSHVGADVLVLELLVREIEDTDPQRFCTISSRVVPFSGSHAFRQLAPDTSYIIRLSTKISSDEQVSTSPANSTKQLQFRTPLEPVFEIDAGACGKNLLVLNQNLSVKNVINKKWHTVRGTVAFDEGIHQWHVRIDTCVSKNIFIGICTAQANLENYVGSDAFGYGYLANKAMWHNKTKLHSYGEIFKQGDLIQVTLDCNARTLAFSRNGESLGVAATNLHVSGGTDGEQNRFSPSRKCKWYPAFSLYNKDDQLTLIPPTSSSASDGSLGGCSQHMSVLEMVHTAQWLLSTHIRRSRDDLDGLEPGIKRIYEDSFGRWKGWCRNTICWREVGRGDVLELDCSAAATEVFGMAAGDSVFTSKGQCVVVGVSNHELWYEVEGESSGFDGLRWKLDSWNREPCRVILESPDEYPIHRMQKQNAIDLESTDDQDSSSTSSPIDLTLLDTDGFVQTQELWSRTNGDVHLMAMLDALAATADHEDPHRLSQSELSTAFVMYDLTASVSNLMLSHKTELAQQHDKNAVLARIFFLLDINQQLIRIIRFMLRNDTAQVPWIDTSPPTGAESADDDGSVLTRMMELSISLASSMSAGDAMLRLRGGKRVPRRAVLDFATRYLFANQKEQIIREALEQSKSQTSSDATKRPSDSSAPSEIVEPPALPQLKIRWPSEPFVPFWRTESRSSATYALPDGKRRANTLFHQLSRQLCELNPSECRHGFTSPLDFIPVMRSFQLQVEGYPSQVAQAGELSDQNSGADSDSASTLELTEQYLKFWDSVMMEIQSPRFPLFIPVDSHSVATADSELSADEDDSRRVELDVNAGLLLPEVASMYLVREEQVLLWYFHVGQILGIAWRSQIILPLRYLSDTVWKDLISGHTESSTESTRTVRAYTTAIGAIRDGICSIVPVKCLHLSTPLSLRARLSDSDEMSVEVLKIQSTYDPDSATHRMFWSVIESFSSLEMRMLLQFLTNSVRSVSAASITHGWSANQDLVEQWQRQTKECDQGTSQRRPRVLSLELADALADAQDHPDSCFPVVVVLEDRQSRLHLPQYSSIPVMRKKLLLSMTTPTSL
ncbi:hypothetical protein Poli38472_002236 [Pythium oligandrum]|uniref:Uncharacterized protein n=1 Tax=Pythium oligandrum TaxID=41045 RepID=A0A8K1CHF8_PYTOL|nr:hypothetical protein Poli38472_002236 [Pythium oligandrum]|eukprot:TMW63295.1 hypothetical protein Poli38472_002236 [Pythium oligandrum]